MENPSLDPVNQTILARLSSATSPLSGEQLARELGLSRVALWKRMESLRRRGCTILSSRQGYQLVEEDLLLEAPQTVESPRMDDTPDFPALIRWHDSIDSTMDTARNWAFEGAPHGSMVLAERQNSGRGQQGRPWLSPGGGLYASLILRSTLPQSRCGTLVLEAGSHLCRYFRTQWNIPVSFQWPNDLMVGTRKLGGMLLESWGAPDLPVFSILGLGINTGTPELEGRQTTGLRDLLPHPPHRRELARILAAHLTAWSLQPVFVPRDWAACSNLAGRHFYWKDWQGQEGTDLCLGFDDSAGIRGQLRTIPYGESRLIRPLDLQEDLR